MGDTHDALLPPDTGDFIPATPSGLTPNTRTEAEAALTLNSVQQTDSAAPTTPRHLHSRNMQPFDNDGTDEAQKAYSRPAGPLRTSSTNYEKALLDARKQSSASSNLSPTTTNESGILDENHKVASPTSTTTPFPAPGQGVVPLNPPVGKALGDTTKKSRNRGMSLSELGVQPSWNPQDHKHMHSSGLMAEVKGDAGYDSGIEAQRR